MKVKLLKKSFFILFFLPLFFLTSCKSNSLPIPGQNKVILKNIHAEYMKLGDTYASLEKYSEAINYYKQAWEDKDLYNSCFYKIAQCYVYLSDWSHALPMYKDLLELDPENNSLKASVAYIYSMSGDMKNALAMYKELIAVQGNDEKIQENYLAIILGDEKFFEENKVEFEESFKLFKNNFPENNNLEIFQKKYDSYSEKLNKDKKDSIDSKNEKK